MDTLKYKGYTGSVEYCEEDDCLYGKVLGMDGNQITYEGSSIHELREDFEGAVNFYIECCHERGIEPMKPYNGKIILSMPMELHSKVAAAAYSAGATINEFINRTMSNALSRASGQL